MKIIMQHDERDCGAACLATIAKYYGLKKPLSAFRELTKTDRNGTNLYGMIDAAKKIGLHSEALYGTPEEVGNGMLTGEIKFPFVAHIRTDQDRLHFVVVFGLKRNKLLVGDPGKGKLTMKMDEFCRCWTGYILTFSKTAAFVTGNECKGSLQKFFLLLKGQYSKLIGVLIISLIIALIGVYSAFVFQVVIDDFYEKQSTVFESGEAADTEHLITEPIGERDADSYEDYPHENAVEEEYWIDNLSVMDFMNGIFNWFSEIIATKSFHVVFLLLIGLYILQAIIQYIRGHLIAIVSRKIDIGITLSYYNHLTELPVSSISNRLTGEYLSRFSDTYTIRNALSTATLTLLLDTIMVIACGIMLYFQNQKLFLISLVMIILSAAIILIYRKPLEHSNRNVMMNSAIVESYFKETLDGMETLKAAGAEKIVQNKADSKFHTFINAVFKNNLISISQETFSSTVELVGTALILWAGFTIVMVHQVTIGQLMTFVTLLSLFIEPIKNLIDLQPTIQTAVIAAERLNDVLELEIEEITNSDQSELPCISKWELRNINFRYGNNELTLENINLTIHRGEKIAIVGESGSGKTTLVKLLLRFFEPESGQILADGQDIRKINLAALRRIIAYVNQNTFMFADTIRNNIILSNPGAEETLIEHVCDVCQVNQFIKLLPLGMDTPLDENGMNLSGGQRQRLSIARALLKEPQLLILDEATSNLDTITESGIKNTIFNFEENLTCLIIAHRLSTVRQCDRIIVMDDGKIKEIGSHEELLRKNGLYAHLWSMQ